MPRVVAGVGVDRPEGADADGHHRAPVLRGGFADLVQDGGDDLIGAAGPGGGDGSAGQHLPGGVEDGGAGLGAAEVDDDVDVTWLGMGRALGWSVDTVTLCSQLAEEVVECGLDVGGEACSVGVFAGDGAQGGAGDRVGVGLGDLVRVEGVVVVPDDKRGDVDGPRGVGRVRRAGTWEGAQDDRILGLNSAWGRSSQAAGTARVR
jgi:hypothetical protein